MIIFSDVMDMIIIGYVWVCLFIREGIAKKTRNAYFLAGLALFVLLLLDQAWQVVLFSQGIPNLQQRQIMTSITSVMYMLLPCIFVQFVWMGARGWRGLKKWIALLGAAVFVAIAAANMFYPILFFHDVNLHTVFLKGDTIYSVLEFIFLCYVMVETYRVNFPADRRDFVLMGFILAIIVIGVVAELAVQDLTALWNSITLAYLLMYVALKNLYDRTDCVTGLGSRASYKEALRRIRANDRVVMVLFDMNRLKHYNDTEGHQKGDAYLRAFANTVREAFEAYGNVFRVGGDEFCLVSCAKPAYIQHVLRALDNREKCDEEYGDFPLDFAYGLAVREDGESLSEVYKRADKRMYIMKRKMHRQSREVQWIDERQLEEQWFIEA